MADLKPYLVWDASIRWFHWINLLFIIGLIAVGVVILNAKALGVSIEGKILLKTIHVWIGYAFALNLLWRLVWAFIGSQHARWKAILPGGKGYFSEVKAYSSDVKAGKKRQYLGHNPLGRIAISFILLLLLAQAITGLVLAGTDIFYPPFGSWIANWIASPGIDPATLVPYAKEMYDPLAYDAMRAFRKPFITVHYYGFYVLSGLIVLHIVAVVVTELREGGDLVSAMFTGKKVLSEEPADKPDENKQ
ncbi:MAG: cytochrome b/b6 domain-containing protein [Gammaproteobacteria bacterium]|nr:cytochrome b/b6 domain-containing protein [Gammaproteobacteria bacterium]